MCIYNCVCKRNVSKIKNPRKKIKYSGIQIMRNRNILHCSSDLENWIFLAKWFTVNILQSHGFTVWKTKNLKEREKERDFYSNKAGNQKGHAHQTWCLLFSNISTIYCSIQTKIEQKRKAKGEKCNTKATKTQEYGKYSTMNEYRLSVC